MRTLGKGIVDIDTPQGATSGAATAATILASSHLGFGLSTTHVATGAILGSGVGRAGAEVRWSLARKLVVAWILTLPGAAIIGGLAALLAGTGIVGSTVLLGLLAAVCVVIWVVSRRNQVTSQNVTESREVMVLASATPSTYPQDPRLVAAKAKAKKKKIKSGV
jgi:PiT family inorganic phosphate transporter